MTSDPRTLYYLYQTQEIAEPIRPDRVTIIDPLHIIFKAIYIAEHEISPEGLNTKKPLLSKLPPNTLLRPVPSSDGPPAWSAIVYLLSGSSPTTVNLREALPDILTHYVARPVQAWNYRANPPGGSYAWETDLSSGKKGYFLTGEIGINALWRITRLQADALNRQVLTLTPIQLTPTLANPLFDKVAPEVRTFLTQHFEGFQRAIVRNAPFDAIDRANNLAEGILTHCLMRTGVSPPDTLDKMLKEAKKILERDGEGRGFTLTYYGYNLVHVIRNLHARLHASESIGEGRAVLPEVGMSLSTTVSELLVDLGLGRY